MNRTATTNSVKKTSGATRILIADDHRIVRAGLRMLLDTEPDFRVEGEAADGIEAVELTRHLAPDILLLDLIMPRLGGLDVLRELKKTPLPVRVILLVAVIGKANVIEALQLGARGVVFKDATTQLLFASIRAVMAGRYWLSRDILPDLVQGLGRGRTPGTNEAPKAPTNLTRRESEILKLIIGGNPNKNIAQHLCISQETVKHHLSSIYDKLGVSSRLELAVFAMHHRLVE